MAKVTIDGRTVEVPAGTNLIEAARQAGVEIPYFCYHPYLSVVGQCRICMVEIEGQPRLAIACATPVSDGMVVKSQTSERVREAREAVMEFLLANHPLDCPVCDQAGECLLQDHAMTEQRGTFASGMLEKRRTFPGLERRLLGPHVIQNQNRCIHCSRCIRFTQEVSETWALTYKSRGNKAYIDTFGGKPFDDPFSACAADVCPVGALTVREFRFRKRAWKLQSTPSVCPGCSIGCNIWIDHHERIVYRFTPRENRDINATWLCDYGRFLAESLNRQEVLRPQRRLKDGMQELSWEEALRALALDLKAAKTLRVVGSGSMSNEELFLARELFTRQLRGELVVPVFAGEPRRMKNGFGQWLYSQSALPNSEGAKRLGLATVDEEGLARFLYGAADLTVVLDPQAHPFLASQEAVQLVKVNPALVVARLATPLLDAATWVLPAASLASNEGSFTSSTGKVQRFAAAVAPAGQARPLWQILSLLARAAGISSLALGSPAEVFSLLTQGEDAFKGLVWHEILGTEEGSYRERHHVG
ncbi:MAG: 2Fe-2S iron-sulfur cluster-binding protein [Thermoanaerobaculum sp.]|nr:2Fe-2S iron-sulfur cluster-binding protein [Thermoanaerobaculum sp.]